MVLNFEHVEDETIVRNSDLQDAADIQHRLLVVTSIALSCKRVEMNSVLSVSETHPIERPKVIFNDHHCQHIFDIRVDFFLTSFYVQYPSGNRLNEHPIDFAIFT